MRLVATMLCAGMLIAACAQATQQDPERSPEAISSALAPLRVGTARPALPHFPAALRAQLTAAGHRVSDLQADRIGDNAGNGLDDLDPDDGGWDWELTADVTGHTAMASAENTYGITALGVWAALRAGADLGRFRTTLLGAGLGAQERPDVDSASDIVFLTLLGDLTSDPGFSELARLRYDARLAAGGGAEAIALANRDRRHAAGHDGLIPTDLAWRSLAAAALDAVFPAAGYAADADAYANVAVADLSSATPLFDSSDAHENFYTHGLALSLIVLARAGSAPALMHSVQQRLLDSQHASGAWLWNGDAVEDNVQATAYALHGLALSGARDLAARRAIQRGARWLSEHQTANGGWLYEGATEYSEVDAEASLALYLSQLAPAVRELQLQPGQETSVAAASAALSVAASAVLTPAAAPAP